MKTVLANHASRGYFCSHACSASSAKPADPSTLAALSGSRSIFAVRSLMVLRIPRMLILSRPKYSSAGASCTFAVTVGFFAGAACETLLEIDDFAADVVDLLFTVAVCASPTAKEVNANNGTKIRTRFTVSPSTYNDDTAA